MTTATEQPVQTGASCAIEARRLCKTYPNGTRALTDVNLRLCDSEFIVVLGPSGAGKSTLLRCMNRLVEPTGGQIHFMGRDVTHVSGRDLRRIRMHVGMIFQQFNLVRRLTVLENVLAGRLPHARGLLRQGLSLLRVFSLAERELAFQCLRKVHIEKLAFQRADTLSGGQQQRVAIARTLAQEPKLILADEPVASLDPASSEIVMQTLMDIHTTQSIPVVVNLHQIEPGQRYGMRIIGMREGRICFLGTAEERDEETLRTIYGRELDSGLGKTKRMRQADGPPQAQPGTPPPPVPDAPALAGVE